MAKLELSGVLSALREEIAQAQLEAENEGVRFRVKDIELELQTAIDWEVSGKGGGKIKFLVFDIDSEASGKYKNIKTHKVKLNLQPLDTQHLDAEGNPSDLQLSDDE